MKKAVSMFLVAIVFVMAIPVMAVEAEEAVKEIPTSTSGVFQYKADGGKAAIVGYTDKSVETLSIPNTIDGNSVIAIGSFGFSGCTSLTTLTIPKGVEEIGSHGFYGCSSLTTLTIEAGLTTIGIGAFSGCDKLTNVNIPESVSKIGENAFLDCPKLTIYCKKDSTAYQYATQNKIPVVLYGTNTSKSQLTLNRNTVTYNGKPQDVAVRSEYGVGAVTAVYYNGSKTVPKNAGTYELTVDVGEGMVYKASSKLSLGKFTIKKADISKASLPVIVAKEWTGKQQKPSVAEFQFLGVNHKTKNHATISYGSNKNIGKGTVTLTGKGNFSGKKTLRFEIIPKKNKLGTIAVGKKQMTVKWGTPDQGQKLTKHVLRYRVKGTSKWTSKTYNASQTSAIITKLTAKSQYEMQMRSYKSVSGTKYYSAWSNVKISKGIK
jgi:hypothetical protein